MFYDSVAKLLYVEPDDMAALKTGEFIISLSGSPPFKFRTNTHLLGWQNSMSDERYEANSRNASLTSTTGRSAGRHSRRLPAKKSSRREDASRRSASRSRLTPTKT